MASVVGVVFFAFSSEKSQHFSRFHTFYGRTGAHVGFLKAICDFKQQFFAKSLSISVSGEQKANVSRIQARRDFLRRGPGRAAERLSPAC